MEEFTKAQITIQLFRKEYEQELIDFIVGIQRNEFGIPITASDQPDLIDIPSFYQSKFGNFWIATCENRIVGTIALLDIGCNMAALRKMFVDALFRGDGTKTAKKLLRTLISWSENHGIKEIFLGTTQKFLAAHKFYEKNGFMKIPKSELPDTFPIMKVDSKFYQFKM
ncbi:MAG: GNAT family N-acetyltransferase [Desulfobacula sp.]|jgi:N-acetylglutamate synthase-like GNAT family acetyltransferase|nr:GNAT family N-acetyltransferase [Desulfobacula sp.]